jgi:AcrR family transcriptional regulator
MKPNRKEGGEGAKTRCAILDATEAIMRQEGYGAVSSRRIAERANLQPSLVHYHFGSMEELFLALNKRAQDEFFAKHIKALTSPDPVRALWDFLTDLSETKLVLELIALASHHEALREELARSGEIVRNIEVAFLSRILDEFGVDKEAFPPAVLSFLIAGAARAYVTEETIGVRTGHAEVLAFIERRLRELSPKRPLDRPPGLAAHP